MNEQQNNTREHPAFKVFLIVNQLAYADIKGDKLRDWESFRSGWDNCDNAMREQEPQMDKNSEGPPQ